MFKENIHSFNDVVHSWLGKIVQKRDFMTFLLNLNVPMIDVGPPMVTIVSLLIGSIGSTLYNSLWKIAKIKTREMSVWAKFAKITSRENFYLYSK